MKQKKLTKKQQQERDNMLAFQEEFKAISEKYKLDIGAVLKYTQTGIFPIVTFIDRSNEQRTENK